MFCFSSWGQIANNAMPLGQLIVSQVTVFPTAVNRHILKKKRNKRMAFFPSLVRPKPYIPMVSLHFNQ